MPLSKTQTIAAGSTWTLLTTGGAVASKITIQPHDRPIYIMASNGNAVAQRPTSLDGAMLLSAAQRDAFVGQVLTDAFGGVAGANHVWAVSADSQAASATVQYA